MKLERAVIEVFGGCNYTCKMCPQTTGRGSSWTRKMDIEMFESILDQITPKYGKPIINLEGSGEPTLARDLPLYVEACTKRGLQSYMYCNGSNLHGQYMRDVIDAGLSFCRFSVIGYDRKTYKRWMGIDKFDDIKAYATEMIAYSKDRCQVSSYHLVLDNNKCDEELSLYRNNFIDLVGCTAYVWKLHNWSGNYNPEYKRNTTTKRTCGRPFAPELTVRAGGIGGKRGAVTPCCQTMGPPNESKSVLGHFEDQTFEEIYYGHEYERLRQLHKEGRFDEIDYCKNCDFLYDDSEVLVWSNDPSASTDYMLGTNFSLKDYQ